MKISLLLLVIGVCVVSAKYLPEVSDPNGLLLRFKRSDSEESNSSKESNVSNDDSDDDNDSVEKKIKEIELKRREKEEKIRQKNFEREEKERKKEEERQRKQEERQRKIEEKKEKEDKKLKEKLEKDRQKQEENERNIKEKIEKDRLKQEENERNIKEKIEKDRLKQEENAKNLKEKLIKEQRKRQEKLEKRLEKIRKDALEQESDTDDSFLETEEENSVEFEDIWRNHIYLKYGLTLSSTRLEKQAALNRYLQEELQIQPNSTKSERRQAILRFIQTRLQNDAAEREALRKQFLSQVNAITLQKLRKSLNEDIEHLQNQTDILKNVSLPWAAPVQQTLEEKRSLLQSLSQFLSGLIPNWFGGNQQNDKPSEDNLTNTPLGTVIESSSINVGTNSEQNLNGNLEPVVGASEDTGNGVIDTTLSENNGNDETIIGSTDQNLAQNTNSKPGSSIDSTGVENNYPILGINENSNKLPGLTENQPGLIGSGNENSLSNVEQSGGSNGNVNPESISNINSVPSNANIPLYNNNKDTIVNTSDFAPADTLESGANSQSSTSVLTDNPIGFSNDEPNTENKIPNNLIVRNNNIDGSIPNTNSVTGSNIEPLVYNNVISGPDNNIPQPATGNQKHPSINIESNVATNNFITGKPTAIEEIPINTSNTVQNPKEQANNNEGESLNSISISSTVSNNNYIPENVQTGPISTPNNENLPQAELSNADVVEVTNINSVTTGSDYYVAPQSLHTEQPNIAPEQNTDAAKVTFGFVAPNSNTNNVDSPTNLDNAVTDASRVTQTEEVISNNINMAPEQNINLATSKANVPSDNNIKNEESVTSADYVITNVSKSPQPEQLDNSIKNIAPEQNIDPAAEAVGSDVPNSNINNADSQTNVDILTDASGIPQIEQAENGNVAPGQNINVATVETPINNNVNNGESETTVSNSVTDALGIPQIEQAENGNVNIAPGQNENVATNEVPLNNNINNVEPVTSVDNVNIAPTQKNDFASKPVNVETQTTIVDDAVTDGSRPLLTGQSVITNVNILPQERIASETATDTVPLNTNNADFQTTNVDNIVTDASGLPQTENNGGAGTSLNLNANNPEYHSPVNGEGVTISDEPGANVLDIVTQ